MLDSPDDRASTSYSQQAKEAIESWTVERIRNREAEFCAKEQIR